MAYRDKVYVIGKLPIGKLLLPIQDGHQSKIDVLDLVPHFCASL